LDKVKRFYPQGHHGIDEEGRPAYIQHIGKVDATQLLEVTTIECQQTNADIIQVPTYTTSKAKLT